MKVLFDHNVDRRFRKYLPDHWVQTTREIGWETLSNGHLLKAAADERFDAIICVDKKIEHEQNLKLLPLPVIILDAITNSVSGLVVFESALNALLDTKLGNALYSVKRDGAVVTVIDPRPKS